MKSKILKSISFLLIMLPFILITSGCSSTKQASAKSQTKTELVFYNEAHLKLVKARIKAKDAYFLKNYEEVIKSGNKALNYIADPVTNKTQLPASKDKHDYMTYAPYAWPDTTKMDGMPWKARDGIVNPVSRGNDTDNNRKTAFFSAIENLVWSYYFSDDKRYADKAIELIRIWYLNPETKVNPNMNFGQAFPGVADGRNAGVHEWKPQSSVITALQMFNNDGILPADVKQGMDEWLSKYLNWLITNPMAISAGFTGQNHANYYNHQVVGLMMYFGETDKAKAVVEDAKLSRIADQIMPDGTQPKEMGRTKSVSYTAGNLWLMTELTILGRKLGIDLWEYESADGRSLKKAYAFLVPYVLNPSDWPKKQISEGGAEKAIEEYMKPLFSKAATVFGIDLIDPKLKAYQKLSPIEALTYPPVEMLPEIK
jgi:hypothetical protein